MNIHAQDVRKIKVAGYAFADGQLIEVVINPVVFERDGQIFVSGEEGDGLVDYYGEGRGGDPYIAPELEAFAAERGLFWEWENPGAIVLSE